MATYPIESDDQNQRELHNASQREERSRNPHSENDLSDEESAAIAARNNASPTRKLAEASPEKQHTRIP